MFKIKLPFYEMAGEIGSAESSSVVTEGDTSGDGNAPTPDSGATHEDVTKQQSFAQRLKESTERALAEERSKWEQETASKYQNYDAAQKALDFLMRSNGISDPMTLKEQIELAELQEKAESQNLTVEELQRRQELEELKAWKQQVMEKEQQEAGLKEFRGQLEAFVQGKEGVDADSLHKYMYDNQTGSMEVAYKAMRYDAEIASLKSQLETAKKDAVKEFLSAKGSIPNVTGSTAHGQVSSPAPKTFADARARAMQRFSN